MSWEVQDVLLRLSGTYLGLLQPPMLGLVVCYRCLILKIPPSIAHTRGVYLRDDHVPPGRHLLRPALWILTFLGRIDEIQDGFLVVGSTGVTAEPLNHHPHHLHLPSRPA